MTETVQHETTVTEMAESFLDVASSALAGIPAAALVGASADQHGVKFHFCQRSVYIEAAARFGLENETKTEHAGRWHLRRDGLYAGVFVALVVMLPAGETP